VALGVVPGAVGVTITPGGFALLGLTAIVAGLAAVLVFAMLRFAAAARDAHRSSRSATGADQALLSAALEEAVAKLKAQERATAERADRSERLSAEIISSLTAGLLVVDRDARVQILNPAGRQMLGLADDTPPERARERSKDFQIWQVVDECLASGVAIRRRTLDRTQPRGETLHFGVTVSPLQDEAGEARGAICLFSDLTAVMELEAQLRLKDSLAAVGELTAGIAHEFRNGLATIHGYSRLLDLDQLPEAYRAYVEGIRHETQALGEIVTNFLNFARPAQLSLSAVNMQELCDRAAEEMRPDAEALGGALVVQGTFGAVEGDEVLLRQAMVNLLRNAVEACAGASILPRVAVEGERDEGQQLLRLTVSDNGPGVEPAAREHVFQPFVTRKRGGTGLGLALVQKIVVVHNGRVTLGEAPGGGASFQVVLPLAQ
jgi:PAS domain S-box-containing protein